MSKTHPAALSLALKVINNLFKTFCLPSAGKVVKLRPGVRAGIGEAASEALHELCIRRPTRY